MAPPVVAIIVGVTVATVMYLMYKRVSNTPTKTYSPHSRNTISDSGSTHNRTRRSSAREEMCSICIYSLESERKALLPCMHRFHRTCIKEWISKAGAPTPCPECRTMFRHYVNY